MQAWRQTSRSLGGKSQVLDEQVQYYIEAATLAEKSGSLSEARRLFDLSIAAADLNKELSSKPVYDMLSFY